MPPSTSSSSVEGKIPPDIGRQTGSVNGVGSGSHENGKDEGPNQSSVAESEDNWQIQPEPEVLDTEADGMAGVVSRALSRISTKSSWNPGPPPDGGRAAWMCALCAHFVIMNTWGIINSFGVFQTYYTTLLSRPPSDISWIGSVQVFLTFFIGAFTGRITDAGFFRPVLLCGTIFNTIGIFTASSATQYWQLLLSQGLCMGIGNGCLFTPAISVVSTYFDKKRSLAIGLTACGSVTGGLVYPAMARQLLPTAGFGWALRAIGFVQLATLLFANVFMKSRLPPRRSGSLVEWGAFKELEYTFYAMGMFFNFWAVYFGFYYVAAFSRDAITPGLSYTDSLNLLLLLNGIGVIGRIIPNHLADTVGPLNMMIPTCLVTGIALLSWIAVHTSGQLYAWTVFYGIAAGGIQSLFPAGLSSLTTDLRKRGTRMGMTFTIVSFAVLTGNPIAGALITACGGSYVGAQAFTGVSIMVGMGFMFAARMARQRRTQSGWIMKM
ncbi:major facilitator superfamily domain-containing protein [Xylariales sp. AK1849]|nr:major facilitator superfamily domain-containing protein [Xylariales sp. AK1849]